MLTPRDIESKMFKVSFKGYNTDEVDDFLQEVCDSYVNIYIENKENREKIERLSEAVGQYKSMEGTLQDALSVADKSTEEIEKDAYRKAAEIVKKAERSAKAIIADAAQKAKAEEEKLEQIKQEMESYRERITDLINAQLSILSNYPTLERLSGKTAEVNNTYKKRVDTQKRFEKKEEITERIDLASKSDMKTEDLPRVYMNEKGEYVTAQ